MFISKAEKLSMQNRIAALEKTVERLIEEKADRRSTAVWTDAARERHSLRLKKAWADKKEQAPA